MSAIIKLLLIFSLTVFASSDDNNIRLELTPGVEGRVRIQWFIDYSEYESAKLRIESPLETNEIQVYESQGDLSGCCFYEEITVTLIVIKNGEEYTVSETITPSSSGLEFVEPVVTPTTSSTTTSSTTTTIFSSDQEIVSDSLTQIENNNTNLENQIDLSNFQLSNILLIEIDNNYLSEFKSFQSEEFLDSERVKSSSLFSFVILILFYIALAIQEWFAKQNEEYDVFPKIKRQAKKRSNIFLLLIGVIVTAFIVSVVEEGFVYSFEYNNLLLLIVTTLVMLLVTILLDGSELFLEKYLYDSDYFFQFSKRVIFFAVISVVMFYYFEFPLGFVYGFVIVSRIKLNRGEVAIPPKIISLIVFLSTVFTAYYLTGFEFVNSSPFLLSLFSFFFLVGIESVLFRLIPAGGNLMSELLETKKMITKILSWLIFFVTIWLFIHCLVTPPSSEVKNLLEQFSTDNIFSSLYFRAIITYIFIMLSSGLFLQSYGTRVSNNFLFQRFS